MLKKIELKIICLFFILIFCGCSALKTKGNVEEFDTLRSAADSKFKQIVWTEQLEKDRLTQDVSYMKTIERSIRLTPQIYSVSFHSSSLKSVYPVLEGFGSLDVSEYDEGIKTQVIQFAENLKKGITDEKLYSKSDIYEAALFLNDLKERWKEIYNEDYPVLKEEEQLFDSFLLGNPFVMNSLYECPVRFNKEKKGFADIMIYFYRKNDTWTINQLKIIRMEAYNESK